MHLPTASTGPSFAAGLKAITQRLLRDQTIQSLGELQRIIVTLNVRPLQMEIDAQTVERYRLKLRYKVCYHLGSFCPDVDDVVQETLARFLTALRDETIRNPERTGAFLSGICNNVISEYRRRLWREVPSEHDASPAGVAVGPEAENMELRDAIMAALAEMSDRDSNVLRAFFLEEKDPDEICRSMGLSEANFRVVLSRAKERFRKIYRQNVKHLASGVH